MQKEAQRKIKRELKAAEEAWQKKIKEQATTIKNKANSEKKQALAALKAEYEAKARKQMVRLGLWLWCAVRELASHRCQRLAPLICNANRVRLVQRMRSC